MALDYWYDAQLRRYWLQFVRIFEGIQYQLGRGSNGTISYRTVPAKLASKSRQVMQIIRNNSENTTQSVPMISCWMSGMQRSPERIQTPNHISAVQVFERAVDPATNRYTDQLGKRYTVERMMAIPYDITMQVDIWTSNEHQKHQIMEQILPLFNPSIDLQTGDNPIDWTSLSIVSLEDITWSDRNFPIGTEDEIEIATLTFKMPIWISPPAKVKKQNIIHQIIANIGQLDEVNGDPAEGLYWSDDDLYGRIIVTPGQLKVDVEGGVITLLNSDGSLNDDTDTLMSWMKTLDLYGKIRPGVSQIRLKTGSNIEQVENDIIGVFDLDPDEPNKINVTYDIDTLPSNTLTAINGIIDPHRTHPLTTLPTPVSGHRYMILNNITSGNVWGDVEADINDIIQYNGTEWVVSFDASVSTTVQYVLNNHTNPGKQYKWTGEMWIVAIDGQYRPGYWRVFL